MASYKVNVSLPEELVAEIDNAAAAAGTTRSGFIAEASARYIVEREAAAAEERRKADIDRAIAHMREVGKKIPRDFDYMKVIREFRERDGWDRPE
jgi:metal-responsive CopG/Arc/MetJ family transcriptional regulator